MHKQATYLQHIFDKQSIHTFFNRRILQSLLPDQSKQYTTFKLPLWPLHLFPPTLFYPHPA